MLTLKHQRGVVVLYLLLTHLIAFSQSGNWDASGNTGAGSGYTDYGNGVIGLVDKSFSGCHGGAIHERTSTFNPVTDVDFAECYEVYFGCPGDDEIGSDTKGDGLAFSFSDCVWSVGACGGGLGYAGGCSNMITVEFDTWSSQGASGFDAGYEGTGNQDQVAIHQGGVADGSGKIAGASAGNLEDGLEHAVCISYVGATDVLSVSIDGVTVLTHDLTGSPYELATYFGSVGLYQSWSSGKNGASNPVIISHGQDITDQVGTSLCDQGAFVTSPSVGGVFGSCEAPVQLTAFVEPPAGNTTDSVEFYADGVLLGSDATADFSWDWTSPTIGNPEVHVVAYYSPSGTSSNSDTSTFSVGGHIEEAAITPTIDGTAEAGFWDAYVAIPISQGSVSAPDLAGSYKIAYDATNLYVLVEVTDDDLRNDSGNDWDDDGVEVYIDYGNDKAGTYGANDFQYSLAYGNAPTVVEYKHGATTGVVYAQAAVTGGYVVECQFPWSTIGGIPSSGDEIGFDIKLNDDDGGGGGDHQLAWKDGTFSAWNNTALFGTQEFDACSPLPVQWLGIEAERTEQTTIITWQVVMEENCHYYQVQWSTDLTNWEVLGEVTALGIYDHLLTYEFEDEAPYRGIVYYRVKQVDFDRQSSLSPIVTLDKMELGLEVWPNPFLDELNVSVEMNELKSVDLLDAFGRELRTDVALDSKVHFDVPPGTYFLRLNVEGRIEFLGPLLKE